LSPASAKELIAHGHEVNIETGAAQGIGLSDKAYTDIGANIVDKAESIFAENDMLRYSSQALQLLPTKQSQVLITPCHCSPL